MPLTVKACIKSISEMAQYMMPKNNRKSFLMKCRVLTTTTNINNPTNIDSNSANVWNNNTPWV